MSMKISETLPHYLTQRDFGMTMFAVLGLHILAVTIYALWPRDAVEEIPVRTLNIKLGADMGALNASPSAGGSVPLPALEPVELADTSVKTTVSQKNTVAPPPQKAADGGTFRSFGSFVADKTKEREKKEEAKKPVVQTKQQAASVPAKTELPDIQLPAALSGAPRQYVRANEAGDGEASQGSPSGAPVDEETIMLRYEQKISAWLQRHKTYPSMARQLGQHGTPVIRIRIDRQGNVKFSSIDQSSGYQMIDRAALDMVKRANPLPTAPKEYPGGALLEFRIPVQFKLN
jgi:TonB family protein